MLDLADQLSDSSDKESVSAFVLSLKNVLEDIQNMQGILPDTSIASSLPRQIKKRASLHMVDTPPFTSTPISAPPPPYGNRIQHGGSDIGGGSPVLRVFNNKGPSPYHMPGTGKPRPLEHDDNMSVGIQNTPINQIEGAYRGLSPSDDWIMSKDRSDTPSTTFAPTITSTHGGFVTTPTSGDNAGSEVRNENMVQYPTSMNVTNQSDFSLNSDWDKEGMTHTHV